MLREEGNMVLLLCKLNVLNISKTSVVEISYSSLFLIWNNTPNSWCRDHIVSLPTQMRRTSDLLFLDKKKNLQEVKTSETI